MLIKKLRKNVSKKREKMDKELRIKAWYHVPTDQLGVAYVKTWFGPLFFFSEFDDNETLSSRFCNFVNDKRDPNSFRRKDFIDLGYLEPKSQSRKGAV